MYKDVEDIKNVISNDSTFCQMIDTIDDIAIMEWDGNFIDGSQAMSLYLEENNLSKDRIRQIILLGKKSSTINRNKEELSQLFPDAEIIIVGKDWKTADIASLHIRHTFVVHIATASHLSAKHIDITRDVTGREEDIIFESRCAYFAIVSSHGSSSLFENRFDCNVVDTLDEFCYLGSDTESPKTPFCQEKTNGLYFNAFSVSEGSSFFLGMDEVRNGCETCNQCTNYGKGKQCPAAQRLIAFFYGCGHYVPEDRKIEFLWEQKAAKQGYKPAIIEIARLLANGIGCEKDVEKALNIYDKYATKGDKDCAKKLIELVDKENSISPVVAVPHIVRLAQGGDEEMTLKLSDALKEGKYGLLVDTSEQKKWIRTGAENGIPSFVKAMAESYETDGDLKNAMSWYRKLQEVCPDEIDEDFITNKTKNILAVIGKTPQGTAELGFNYINGYEGDYDPLLAYLCFCISAEADNPLGISGLATCYNFGKGIEEDKDLAIELYKKAVEKGSLRAAFGLYHLYKSDSSHKDIEEEEHWQEVFENLLEIGIANDDPFAYRTKGIMLAKGQLFGKDLDEAFYMFEKAYEMGDITSSYFVGKAYLHGEGVEKNIDKAIDILKVSAAIGHYKSKGELGNYYYKAPGYSYSAAFPLLKESAERGFKDSYMNLAECYYFGRGTSADKNKAYKWYEKAAEVGNSEAMGYVCHEYYNGEYLPKDNNKSVYWGNKALDAGNKGVRFRLAWLLDEGDKVNVKPDYEKAYNLYTELANEGNHMAMNNLGWMYECGDFVEKDESKAFEWYLKSAEAGDDVASRNVGYCYRRGFGVDQDYEKSREWFIKGAERGDISAMKQVAYLYKGNCDTEADPAQVVKWYQKAIDAGDDDAILDLGYAYEHGEGVEKDYDKAISLFRQAAVKGMTVGFYNMGIMYQYAKGVEKDEQTAIYWYRKAAAKGYAKAKEQLKELGTNWIDENQNFTDNID